MACVCPQVGDWVKLHVGGGIEGTIKEVSLRHTTVTGFDHHVYHVKNRDISNAVVENVFDSLKNRVDCSFVISAGYDPGRVQQFLNTFRKEVLHIITRKGSLYVWHPLKLLDIEVCAYKRNSSSWDLGTLQGVGAFRR
eukprot:9503817-Pyramimonas_sp.AAC.1